MSSAIASLWRDQRGAVLIEYGLLLVLVAVAALAALYLLATQLAAPFDRAGSALTAAAGNLGSPQGGTAG